MGLEVATTIGGLNANNPLGTDQKSTADDHLRLIKSCLKNTFPNMNGVTTATPDELNTLVGMTGTVAAQLAGKATAGALSTSGITGAAASGTNSDITGFANAVTGITATAGDNTSKLATTAFVLANQVVVADATTATKGKLALSTNAEVQAGTDAVKAVTPASLKAAVLGIGQAWSNVTGSRNIGGTFNNGTGRAIQVSVYTTGSTSTYASLTIGGVLVATALGDTTNGATSSTLSAIVPPGANYSVTGTRTLSNWAELS